MKALFVCTGNSCRSVMAEYLFNKLAGEAGMNWQARSCGTASQRTFPIPKGVHHALGRAGIAKVKHTPQLVSPGLMEWADHVFAMTAGHAEALKAMHPGHAQKVALFLEAAGLGAEDVRDPIGKPDAEYEQCCDLIQKGVQNLIEKYAKRTSNSRS